MKYRLKITPIDKWVINPVNRFIGKSTTGGIVLFLAAVVALILANSPWKEAYHHFWEHKFSIGFDGKYLLDQDLHHWINDGLMAIFFLLVGLEIKRELIEGELSSLKNASLPIFAAIGGMLVPALIFVFFNYGTEYQNGWGIPMATDIAFSLAIISMLGKRVPASVKIFLTALAIVDDLGAVLVIAFFYTSDISMTSLAIGLGFILIMYAGNKMGIRNILFYAFVGIIGVWIAFLLSGVHATIAAVLAAFTIPADVKIKESDYYTKIQKYLSEFSSIDPNNKIPTLTHDQLHLLDEIKKDTNSAIPPLQRLEHAMHPLVTFFIIPIFAIANAGVSLDIDVDQLFSTNVAIGVALGLLLGKVIGVVGFTMAFVKLKIAPFPTGMNVRNLFGLGLLAAIGFTMSLFITSLAFTHEEYMVQAKIGIFTASIIGGVLGYFILSKSSK